MLTIKRCPFCGELPNVYQINSEDYCECLNPCCPISIDNGGEAFKEEVWNHRPVEENLYEMIKSYKHILEIWRDREAENKSLIYAGNQMAEALKRINEKYTVVWEDGGECSPEYIVWTNLVRKLGLR